MVLVLDRVLVGAFHPLEHAALPVGLGVEVVEGERPIDLVARELELRRRRVVRRPRDVDVKLGPVRVELDRALQVAERVGLRPAPAAASARAR